MPIERHLVDVIYMSLFQKEAVYGQGVSPYDNTTACQMTDYDDASAHITLDDMLQANNDVITGKEFPTHQEIPRQSFGMTYTEPRTKPNTLAGLLALTMGAPVLSTRDKTKQAWRHALSLGGATTLPSIVVQVNYDQTQIGTGFRYYGVKCSTLTLSNNGAYWQLAATLMGSGRRQTSGSTLLRPDIPVVQEHWLRWGDTRFFLRPLVAGRIIPPTAPTQRANNLIGGATTRGTVEMSPFIRSCSLTVNNNFAADAGYRPWSGLYRSSLHGTRREITVEMTFDIESDREIDYLENYFEQYNMGLEIDCGSTEVIDPNGGTYRYGFQLLLPALRLTQLTRGQQDMLENLTYSAIALDDGVNAPMYAWVFNRKSLYLK